MENEKCRSETIILWGVPGDEKRSDERVARPPSGPRTPLNRSRHAQIRCRGIDARLIERENTINSRVQLFERTPKRARD